MDALFACDPGTTESAILTWNGEAIGTARIMPNEDLLAMLQRSSVTLNGRVFAIEMLSCYGARVGRETFQTLRWIGRFEQVALNAGARVILPERREVCQHFGITGKGKDSAIAAVMKDRFGEKGTKLAPGVTYKLSSHLWQAFALAVFAFDTQKNEN